MMGTYGLLVLFAFIGLGASTIRLNIASDGNYVLLKPQTGNGRVETRWELKSCKGCKMVLGCQFRTQSCNDALFKIDTGGSFSQHCPEESVSVFNTSNKDFMSVTIENNGPDVAAFCHVKATGKFIDLPEVDIDSSEHGSERLSKKKPTCRCGWTNKSPARIVNGKEAGVNEYPFIALIIKKITRFPFCGGSIITVRHILTAAHCTYSETEALSVLIGEHDIRTWKETKATKIIDVQRIINHPDYNNITQVHDIAILELKDPIEFSNLVGRVCMPSKSISENEYSKVMGWGLLSTHGNPSPVLMKVNVKTIDIGICGTIYMLNTTARTQICTYNNQKDSCQGDSGGPLVHLNPKTNMLEQVALVSFGRDCASTDPGVNTDVKKYEDWIKNEVKGQELCY
uniref:Venom S1 protease 3 n=1 Tax=Oncocephalus sp. TaxID=2944721 RepID=A0AB38ZEF1_9HEMI